MIHDEWKMRLENWGYWSRVERGEPATFPASEPFLKWAKTSEFTDEGWAQFDAAGNAIEPSAPEAPRLMIHERDAVHCDAIIKAMSNYYRYLLRDAYVKCEPQVFNFTRHDDEKAYITLAEDAFRRAIQPFACGKQKVIELLEQKWKTRDIVKYARVTRQYVARIKKSLYGNNSPKMETQKG